MKKRISYFEALATFIGCIIGAGILAIPYSFYKSGFLIGCIVMISVLGISVLRTLMLAEIALRTKDKHQVPGLIGVYLGPFFKRLSFWTMAISCIGAIIVYIIGSGRVLSYFFNLQPVLLSTFYFVFIAYLVYHGIKIVKKTELVMILFLFFVIFLIGVFSLGKISFENFSTISVENWIIPYGVLMFAFFGSIAVPEVKEVLVRNEHMMKSVVIRGYSIVFLVYLLFTIFVLGVIKGPATEIATIGISVARGSFIDKIINILALVVITEAFITVGYGLIGMFQYDMKLSHKESWFIAMFVPFVLFIIGAQNIIALISVVGGIFMGFQTILTVFSFWKAKSKGTRKPEMDLGNLPFAGWGLVIISLIGAIVTLIFELSQV